jgi:valyl-tRNA synthetase
VSARSEEEARKKAAERFQVKEDKIVLTQDPDVLDTWCALLAGWLRKDLNRILHC